MYKHVSGFHRMRVEVDIGTVTVIGFHPAKDLKEL